MDEREIYERHLLRIAALRFRDKVEDLRFRIRDGETVYEACPLKPTTGRRRRATNAEMEDRRAFLCAYASVYHPVTVRQLFYAATVHNVPGIGKDENGYVAVQRSVLDLRREGHMPYGHIADASRIQRKFQSYNGIEDALQATARTYRKALWYDRDDRVEIWLEKDALAGVISEVTAEYDVPLMSTRGFTSETFAHSSVAEYEGTGCTLNAYCLYDFDRAGQDAYKSLEEKLVRFGDELGVNVNMVNIGVNLQQIEEWNLPSRPAKKKSAADRNWPYDFAVELDAIRPDMLREIVREAIENHLPVDELDMLKEIEKREREDIMQFVTQTPESLL